MAVGPTAGTIKTDAEYTAFRTSQALREAITRLEQELAAVRSQLADKERELAAVRDGAAGNEKAIVKVRAWVQSGLGCWQPLGLGVGLNAGGAAGLGRLHSWAAAPRCGHAVPCRAMLCCVLRRRCWRMRTWRRQRSSR